MRYAIIILALLTAGFGRAPERAATSEGAPRLRGDSGPALSVRWRYSQKAGWVECGALRAPARVTRYAIPARTPYAFRDGLLIVRDGESGDIVFVHDLHGRICGVRTRQTAPARLAAR